MIVLISAATVMKPNAKHCHYNNQKVCLSPTVET